jgi:hypothetical protein
MTDPMKLGSYLDACLLDPKEKENFYDKSENPHLSANGACASKLAKAWAQEREDAGKFPLSGAESQMIKSNIEHIRQHPVASEMLDSCDPQVAMFGELEGIPFKGLIDITPHKDSRFGDGLADLKRTIKFLPREFKWHVRNMGYNVQGAAYLDMWNAIQRATGGDDFRTEFYLLVSNSASPYACGVAKMDRKILDEGRAFLAKWIPAWKHSIENDSWLNPYDMEEELFVLD